MRMVAIMAALAGAVSLGACSSVNSPADGAAEAAIGGGAAAVTSAANPIEQSGQAAEVKPAATAVAQGVQVAQASSTTDANKKICKSIKPIGSIRPKRVCSTQAEWDQFASETGESADKFNELRRSGSLAPAKEGQQFPRR